MANTKITADNLAANAVTASSIADNSIGITQLNVSDGTNGQVLTTNGSGTLSFGDIPAGYTDSDVETYLDGGTSTPTFSTATVTGDLTVDTDTLYVDSTNNRVGIGWGAPDSKLGILHSGSSTAGLNISDGSTSDFQVHAAHSSGLALIGASAGSLGVKAGGTEYLRIDSTGDSTFKRKLIISGDDSNNRFIIRGTDYQWCFDNASNRLRIFREDDGTGANGSTTAIFDDSGHVAFGSNVGAGTNTQAGMDISGFTNSIKIPSGTTAQRPTGQNAMFRYNSTENEFEGYANGNWIPLAVPFEATGGTITTSGGYTYHTFTSSGTFTVTKGTKTVEYLIVGGGGGGGSRHAGGGGAGGYRSGTFSASPQAYTVTVGAAGSGGVYNTSLPTNGGNSSISSVVTSTGGGAGGQYSESSNVRQDNGSNGGSGGGASNAVGTTSTGGSGTSGQGNDGGDVSSNGSNWAGAGGGGASAAGGNGSSGSGNSGGAGGAGSQWSNGTYYAGGGGGGGSQNTATGGAGGIGGGGAGGGGDDASQTGLDGTAGTANTGGGGGGSRNNDGGNGGSGIVIIRYQV